MRATPTRVGGQRLERRRRRGRLAVDLGHPRRRDDDLRDRADHGDRALWRRDRRRLRLGGGTDARSEFTVDFGFYPGPAPGRHRLVRRRAHRPGTYTAYQENDGIYQSTELPAAGVDVELWTDNGDGVFEPDDRHLVGHRDDRRPGPVLLPRPRRVEHYLAVIPSGAGKADGANNNGTVLDGWRSSTVATAATTAGNDTDHGDDLSLSDAYAATSSSSPRARRHGLRRRRRTRRTPTPRRA